MRPVTVSEYAGAALAGGWNPELPNTQIEVILELDGGWQLDLGGQAAEARSFAAGLVLAPVRTRSVGAVRLVQLAADPLLIPALFGVPAGELAGVVAPLDRLMPGRSADELLERLDAIPSLGDHPTDRPEHLGPDAAGADTDAADPRALTRLPRAAEARRWAHDAVHRAATERGPIVPADVHRAVELLRRSGGTIEIGALAAELRCSRRHLARRFGEWVGASPSQFRRLVRFEAATDALRADPSQPLGPLALDRGYADHAHMDREFRALAGAPPSVVAARMGAQAG